MSETATSSTPRTIGGALIILALLITAFAVTYGLMRGNDGTVPEGFVYSEDGQFWLDGEPYFYAGANAYTLMFETEAGVQMYLRTFAAEDLRVARVWGFNDIGNLDGTNSVTSNQTGVYFQYFDPELGRPVVNDGPDGLQKLDYLIYAAGEHDIRLVLPFVNNWTAYGGIDQYVRWAEGQYHDDFFHDETIRGWYKDYVRTLLERENPLTGVKYKDDPTIMIWELGNELRCSDSGPYPVSERCTSDMFDEWAIEMAEYVKSIAPHQMVGFGGEGFLCNDLDPQSTLFNCTESGNPEVMLASEFIDVHGIHVYPNHWHPQTPTSDWEEWGVWWIEEHGRIAAEAGVPYYIGEYGWLGQNERARVFEKWLTAFHNAGGDGSHYWLLQPAESIAPAADGVGFSQRCPGPACQVVTNWTRYLNGTPWDQFAPVASGDFTTAAFGEVIEIDVLANDIVYGGATWDIDSIDLDPETAGIQREYDSGVGIFRVTESGTIMFESHVSDPGTARVNYVVADSRGAVSNAVRISVQRTEVALEDGPENGVEE